MPQQAGAATHTRLRGLVHEAFTPHLVERLRLAMPAEKLRWRTGYVIRGLKKLPVVF